MQTNERVVVIKGDASKWYSQAVFIINPGTDPGKIPKDFVAEAENIIYSYMEKKQKNAGSIHAYMDCYTPPTLLHAPGLIQKKHLIRRNKMRFWRSIILYVLMIAACIAMTVVLTLGLIN